VVDGAPAHRCLRDLAINPHGHPLVALGFDRLHVLHVSSTIRSRSATARRSLGGAGKEPWPTGIGSTRVVLSRVDVGHQRSDLVKQ